MSATQLLSDVKIADMTTVIFGPYCTQTLADMGADVVKVEPKGGDTFRMLGKPAKNKGMGSLPYDNEPGQAIGSMGSEV